MLEQIIVTNLSGSLKKIEVQARGADGRYTAAMEYYVEPGRFTLIDLEDGRHSIQVITVTGERLRENVEEE